MKNILIFPVFLLLLMLGGCGTYSQTVQVNDHAYLLLIGNPDNNVVVIDDGAPINLGEDTHSYSLNGRKATKIQIPVGRHTLKVTKGAELIINRDFYVSTGTSFEVEL